MQRLDRYTDLPVWEVADSLLVELRRSPSVVLTAPPGAGKSTLLPLTVLLGWPEVGRILMLEPRRLAARQVAERMADMLGEPVGHTVGYRVRHDTCVSAATRLEVVTEGVLVRMLLDDPTLSGVGLVIFDEFHERNLFSDESLALTRQLQQVLRDDLRLLVMSATIDAEHICHALSAPLVESRGRQFPVSVSYMDADVVHAVHVALRDEEGDILVFLPGEAEIRRTAKALSNVTVAEVCPLMSRLSSAEQQRAIRPIPGRRKVVLATNIAETSLTIEGIRVVIDSGLMRTLRVDPSSGLPRLETVQISQDMATQRMGRAGRLTEGVCYRLYPRAVFDRMAPHRTPEILTQDLCSLRLDLAVWGTAPAELEWLTPPPADRLREGEQLLHLLGALDAQQHVTALGRRIARLPYHPRLARMMLSGDDRRLAERIAEVLEEGRGTLPHTYAAGRLLAMAYPERIAMALGHGRFRLANGIEARVDDESLLSSEHYIVAAQLHTSSAHIYMAAPLSEDDLTPYIYIRACVRWDMRQGGLVSRQEKRVGQLLISDRPLAVPPAEECARVICAAAHKDGLSMFDMSAEACVRMQERIRQAGEWHPEWQLPEVDTDSLMQHAEDWLPLYLTQGDRVLTTVPQLRKLDMAAIIYQRLTYDQQQLLDRYLPSHIEVPTGSRIRIDYRPGASAPVVSVRLQECFGLVDTPAVDGGRVPLLMELLSPGFKPVQLTRDLRSFWSGTYFDVRRELLRRYPKHAWPEDPLTATPTRGAKRRS